MTHDWLLRCKYTGLDSLGVPRLTSRFHLSPNIIILSLSFSLSSGLFILLKQAISPTLNNSALDKEQLSNYRPVFNLSIVSEIIERTVKSRLACLCLLDLSAVFDTIDHNILIIHLSSWFGIHGSVLNWCKSYPSFRSFRVKCQNCFVSSHTCLCGVSQGTFLGLYSSSRIHHPSQYL